MGKGGSVSVQGGKVMSEGALVNTGAVCWPDPVLASVAVRSMQSKLHRWAGEDPSRRFGDLFNLVYDPAFLVAAWERVSANKGAKTAGIDKVTAAWVETVIGVGAFLGQIRDSLKSGRFRPVEVRQVMIPKGNTGKFRKLGIPTIADRVVQASLKSVLEPIFEADFQPCSYGFRPIRRPHDAIAEIHHLASAPRNYHWVLECDIRACFDEISHTALVDRLRARIKDKRICALVKAFLKSGVLTELGDREDTLTGTPQGGIITPPTQWITRAMVTLRIGLWGLSAGRGPLSDGDAMADGDLLGADQDVFDEQPQHALALFDAGGAGLAAQLGEEAFQVVGELEVALTVSKLGVQGADLGAQARFASAQAGHAGAEFVDGDQLLLERLDHGGDRSAGLGERKFQVSALACGGVRGAGLLQALVDLGPDQRRAGEQAGDVVPDDLVEVVGADWLVAAHPPAFVSVVIRPQAPVVVDLPAGGAGGGAVVAVSAGRAGSQALQQGGDLGVAGGEPLVVLLPLAGTGIWVHSSFGRSTVLTARGVVRPCRRATRFRAGDWLTVMVLPNTAVPA